MTAAKRVARFGSQVCGSSDVSRSVVTAGLASTECGLRHAVLRETWGEPLEGSLSNLVKKFSGPLLLKDYVAVHSQDVLGATPRLCRRKENSVCGS